MGVMMSNNITDTSVQILSNITAYMKYAKYLPDKQRRELWNENTDRVKQMHIKKFPELREEIEYAFTFVNDKKVLPSMRSMQFAGKPIEVNPVRQYNCSYVHIDHTDVFAETMFLLLSGTGVGYSVQKHHIRKLPPLLGVQRPEGRQRKKRYLIGDSIEGWSDAVKVLIESYFYNKRELDFDFRDIRPKGTALVTSGGKAPGPEPLRECLTKITSLLENAIAERGRATKLTTLEAHDIMCFIADAVLSGGIRRAAMISLFSLDDSSMLECKFGSWWETNPQRGRANNSAVILRSQIEEDTFQNLWNKVKASRSGEPGFFMSNSEEWGGNPCFTGDMKLLTDEGYKTFESLNNTQPNIVNKSGKITKGKVWSNGVKKTVKVYFRNKDFAPIQCTPDHKFLVGDEWIEATNLKGRRITTNVNEMVKHNKEHVRLGFIQGDGCLGRLKSKEHIGLEINIGEKDKEIFELFGLENNHSRKYYTRGYNEKLKKYGFSSEPLPNRKFPKKYFESLSDIDKFSFLRGLYSANGSVIRNHRISFKTTCKDMAEEIVSILSTLNIFAYITTNKAKNVTFSNGEYTCKESYDVNISKYKSMLTFYNYIGFEHKYKMDNLKEILINFAPIVLKISDEGSVEVYDFYEPEEHAGFVGEAVVHNCMEISLRSFQMCNLVEVNFATVKSQEDLEERTKVASFIATLQASYTDFHYLRDIWRETTEKEALIGVSLTGVASKHLYDYDLEKAAKVVVKENKRVAKLIGINPSARCTTNKPSGTSSIVLGTSSGVHAWYAPYYWRRIKVGKDEAIYSYLHTMYPELLEDDYFRPEIMAVIKVPQKSPDGGITRSETAIDSLKRIKYMHEHWIAPGHVKGINKNNVSCFSGDTKFLVEDKGYVSFNSFNDGDTVRVLTHDGTYTNAIVKNFGKQEIVELKVTTGGGLKEPKIIKTTKDHFWFVSNNYRRHSSIDLPDEKYRIIKTKNLLSIKKPQFPRVYPTKKVTEINLEGLLHGIVFGDGSRTPIRRKNGLGGFISLCHESRHLKKYFIEAGYSVKENDSINQTYIGKLPWEWKELPKTDDPKYIFSFIAGWFASDGYVSSEKRNVNITCIQEDAMKWLMDKAPICGISTSHTYSSYSITKGYKPGGTAHTINFIKESLPDEFFVHEKKLQRWLKGKPKTYQSPKYFSVLEINYTGKYEDVWCVIEPKNSAFVIEGNILTHNCTISIRDEEWEDVGKWMWENRDYYTGIAVLPFDNGSYTQAPFEECTKEEYEEAMKHLSKVDLQYIIESKDNTNLQGEIACGGGACDINSV